MLMVLVAKHRDGFSLAIRCRSSARQSRCSQLRGCVRSSRDRGLPPPARSAPIGLNHHAKAAIQPSWNSLQHRLFSRLALPFRVAALARIDFADPLMSQNRSGLPEGSWLGVFSHDATAIAAANTAVLT